MDLNNLLLLLGKHLGINDLRLNSHDICCIGFEQDIEVFIENDAKNQYTHLYTVLGDIVSNNRERFFEDVLTRNLFGRQTGESTIYCDIEQGEVLLCRIFNAYQLDGESFIKLVDQFVDNVVEQRIWLNSFDGAYTNTNSDDLIQVESYFLRI